MTRFDLLLALGCSVSTLACGAILGLQEPIVDNTIEGGTTDTGGGDTSSDVVIDTACGADLQGDSKNCGNCGHDCLGGGCTAGVCQPVLIASSTSIAPYAMVMNGNDLYFTNVKGSALATVFKVDKTQPNGNPTLLADYAAGYTTPPVSGYPESIAVQGSDFYVSIYSNGGSNGMWEAGVDRCPQSGCTAKTLGYYGVNSYAVATNSSNVYFASSPTSDVYTVEYAKLDMTGQQTLVTPTSEVNGLLVDNSDLFYATSEGVFHCNGTTCGGTAITQGAAIDAELMALDATNVYFTSLPFNSTASVQSVVRGGGLPKLISDKPAVPFGVATDGTHVYFTDIGDNTNPATGAVYRCPVAGCNGQEETISTGAAAADNPRPVVVDATAIYWGTRGGKIWRLAK